MTERKYNEQTINDYLYLLYCGVSGNPVDKTRIDNAALDTVGPLARENGLSSFLAELLSKNNIRHELFEYDRDYILRHQLILEKEAAGVMALLEEHGITHAPLKGLFIKDLYPAFATRVMGDIDILIDKKQRKTALKILKDKGYSSDFIDPEYHDSLCKNDVTVELHSDLLHEGPSKGWERFNQKVFERLTPVEGYENCKNLTVEDHYIYMVAHAYKHSSATGIGLRFLLDLWYFRHAFPKEVSSDYVRETIKELLIGDYEENAIRASELIFSEGACFTDLSEADRQTIETYIDSGINGAPGAASDVIAELSTYQGKGLIASYFSILKFLDAKEDWYALRSPFAYRHKWARPFYIMKLGLKAVARNPKMMK